jgi:N6-adenosine-specific RNA methylase IME4
METADICALPIADLAADDSVLFLWATSPKLQEALTVIEAWEFRYITCMIWDKEWIGPGYYARQCHELLLICKRGALPVPLPENRPPSVYHERRTEHSKKPVYFYEMIEKMYPGLSKVELFAREARAGWTAWGNEL